MARELGGLLRVLSNQDRILIIQLLATRGEHSVGSIAEGLDLPGPRVSQHLSVLRAHRIVSETRRGRERIYELAIPEIAQWLIGGVDFVADLVREVTPEQVDDARSLWQQAFRK